MDRSSGYTIQSVERAIAILRSFSLEKPERSVTELSRELGLHKSTTSRLMATLEKGGLLSRHPTTELYRLSVDLIGMAAQVISHINVRTLAEPVLRALADSCQETVDLVVLDAGQVINLDQFVPPARRVMNIGAVGLRASPHCAAAGKVLLAQLSEEELSQVLPAKLERFTPRTITDPQQFRRELARVREQGYAIAQEEYEEWLNVVAAPIHDHACRVIAAVSIAGPAYRVTPALFPHLAIQVKDAAATISRSLGYSG